MRFMHFSYIVRTFSCHFHAISSGRPDVSQLKERPACARSLGGPSALSEPSLSIRKTASETVKKLNFT